MLNGLLVGDVAAEGALFRVECPPAGHFGVTRYVPVTDTAFPGVEQVKFPLRPARMYPRRGIPFQCNTMTLTLVNKKVTTGNLPTEHGFFAKTSCDMGGYVTSLDRFNVRITASVHGLQMYKCGIGKLMVVVDACGSRFTHYVTWMQLLASTGLPVNVRDLSIRNLAVATDTGLLMDVRNNTSNNFGGKVGKADVGKTVTFIVYRSGSAVSTGRQTLGEYDAEMDLVRNMTRDTCIFKDPRTGRIAPFSGWSEAEIEGLEPQIASYHVEKAVRRGIGCEQFTVVNAKAKNNGSVVVRIPRSMASVLTMVRPMATYQIPTQKVETLDAEREWVRRVCVVSPKVEFALRRAANESIQRPFYCP